MAELIDALRSLVAGHEETLWLLGLGSVAMAVASLVALPALIVRLPADYFVASDGGANARGRGIGWLVVAVVKNALGSVLLVAGFAMLFLPGQGLLTMLVAVVLLDFPGKQRLERRLVERPAVLRAANRIREWWGRPPLRV